jgi:hypothetical protein
LFAVAVAALFALLVLRLFPGLLDGRLVDTDSYMRLVRVRQLLESWSWFDSTVPRSNAPFGETLHWTRPVDVLILLGTVLTAPLLGLERALHVAGVLLSPALLVAICFVTAWAVRPLATRRVRYYAMIAVLAQVGVMGYALPGRADHHMPILLTFVAMHGSALRLLLRTAPGHAGWATGAWAALGLWISTEFLVPLAVLLVVLVLVWIRRGEEMAARGQSVALGLIAVTALALLVEHPPSALLVAEYDRVSVVHLLVAVVVVAFWAGAASAAGSRLNPVGRFGFAVVGGGMALGLVAAAYPGFFGGPMVDVDPELKRTWLPYLTEFQPFLVPQDVSDIGRILAYLGTAFLACGVVAHGLRQDRDTPRFDVWVLLGGGLLAFIPLGIRWVRFVMYAEMLGVLGTMFLLVRALSALEARYAPPRLGTLRAVATTGLLAGPLLAGALIMLSGQGGGARLREAGATQTQGCSIEELVSTLAEASGLGDRPRTVLAHVDLGPMLLYRTPHSVIATPYHRNAAGILGARRIFEETSPDGARQLVAERAVDVIVTCGVEEPPGDAAQPSLVARLRSGSELEWLAPWDGGDTAGGLGIWQVVGDLPDRGASQP